MTADPNILTLPEYQEAKAQLLHKLQAMHCTVTEQTSEKSVGERLIVLSPDGDRHHIHIRLLNLDTARSIKIPQSDFEPGANSWILLALYMHDMPPISYLIPTTVFAASNDLFIVNQQPPQFSYLSNWEIKIYQKAVPELSRYALEAITKL